MIHDLGYLLIYVIIAGLMVLALFWILENVFKLVIPLVVKQATGIIALILIGLYLLSVFRIA